MTRWGVAAALLRLPPADPPLAVAAMRHQG